jgi:hypothetical protein
MIPCLKIKYTTFYMLLFMFRVCHQHKTMSRERCCQMAATTEWCGGFLDKHHRQFVKGCPPGGAIGCNGVFIRLDFGHILLYAIDNASMELWLNL